MCIRLQFDSFFLQFLMRFKNKANEKFDCHTLIFFWNIWIVRRVPTELSVLAVNKGRMTGGEFLTEHQDQKPWKRIRDIFTGLTFLVVRNVFLTLLKDFKPELRKDNFGISVFCSTDRAIVDFHVTSLVIYIMCERLKERNKINLATKIKIHNFVPFTPL